jgi:hypothetical protein
MRSVIDERRRCTIKEHPMLPISGNLFVAKTTMLAFTRPFDNDDEDRNLVAATPVFADAIVLVITMAQNSVLILWSGGCGWLRLPQFFRHLRKVNVTVEP